MGESDMDSPHLVSDTRVESTRRLRALWCRRSSRAGWGPPDDWWAPAVDSVCRAALGGADLGGACQRFGRARARAGVGIGATLDDFNALCEVLRWLVPPSALVKAVAEGWVEGGCARDDCQDPLTGLTTLAYLRTRLGELYRAEVDPPPDLTHRLLIIGLDAGVDPWQRTGRLIVLGHELRGYFPGGETLSLLSRSRIGVLTPIGPGLAERVEGLRDGLAREHAAEVWNVPMPSTWDEALAFLTDVGRPATPP